MYRWIHRVWYDDGRFGWVLSPLSWLYRFAVFGRRLLFRCKVLRAYKVDVPVVVVGNISVGGTGKTPVVIWLAKQLSANGFRPGIVSRGYGGSHSDSAMRVDVDSAAAVVGDEPLLLARRTQCPVMVDRNRVRGARMLIEDGVDVVLADDGLQHSRLRRDFEICVVDGKRGLGNGRLLPAGPLRESEARLARVDQVLVNGDLDQAVIDAESALSEGLVFHLQAVEARRLDGSSSRPIDSFRGKKIHAIAGIGNPQRFFDLMRSFGAEVIEHAYPDHQTIAKEDLNFGDGSDVLMTEKDAVKIVGQVGENVWFVPVELMFETDVANDLMPKLMAQLEARMMEPQ